MRCGTAHRDIARGRASGGGEASGRFLWRRWASGRGVQLAKQEAIEMEGVVTEVLPDQNFRVRLDNGHEILAYAAGRMSRFRIRVLVGDRVSVSLSPYDLSRGRITYRHKAGSQANPPAAGVRGRSGPGRR